MKKQFECGLLLIVLLVISCKTLDSKSRLQHEYGATSRERSEPLEKCDHAPEGTVKEASEYLHILFQHIAQANPDTFKGFYSPPNFCVNVMDSEHFQGAGAQSTNGAITFGCDMILVNETDAAIAGVLSHEAAHVSMQHRSSIPHPKLANNKEFVAANTFLDKAWDIGAELSAKSISLNTEANSLQDQLIKNLPSELNQERIQISDKSHAVFDEFRRLSLQLRMNKEQCNKYAISLEPVCRYYSAENPYFAQDCESILCSFLDLSEGKFDPNDPRIVEWTKEAEKLIARAKAFGQKEQAVSPQAYNRISELLPALKNVNREIQAMQQREMQAKETVLRIAKEAHLSDFELDQWKEEEADEVGYELYLRSGFHPIEYSKYFFVTLEKNSNSSEGNRADYLRCREIIELEENQLEAYAKAQPPDRLRKPNSSIITNEEHPSDCWRIYNLHISERLAHKIDYELFANSKAINIFPAKLASAKQACRNLKK